MKNENLIVIENIDNDLLSSFILDQFSCAVLSNRDIVNAKLVKGTTENTKSEINFAIEFLMLVGPGIASAAIYDYLKKIFKSIGKKQKCRFKVVIGKDVENIEIYYSDNSNDVEIEIRK